LDEKLELVEEHRDAHGLNACLEALGVSKGSWHYRMRNGSRREERQTRDQALKPLVVEVIGENPAYGYRRIQPDLELATGEAVNHKRLRRLLNQWDLALHRAVVRPVRLEREEGHGRQQPADRRLPRPRRPPHVDAGPGRGGHLLRDELPEQGLRALRVERSL